MNKIIIAALFVFLFNANFKKKKEKQILQLVARNVPVIHISSENNEGGSNDII